MVVDILGYLGGYAYDIASKAYGTIKNKIPFGKEKKLPESVLKSGGDIHPVTGEYIKEHKPSHYSKRPSYAELSTLLIPLIIGSAWLAFLLIKKKTIENTIQLSPPNNLLIITLSIFIILYTIFLILALIGRMQALKKNNIENRL